MNHNKPIYMMILPLFSSLRLFTLILLLFPSIALAAPSLDKFFSPATISSGSISTLSFTLTNPDASPVSDLAFIDSFPAGLTIATPSSAFTDCTDAILSAPDGGNTISLSNSRLASNGASCTINVNVTATTTATNVTGTLSSSAGAGGTATATLTVDSTLPTFSKSFSPSTIPLGGTSTLTFDISSAIDLFSLRFSDNLPADMIIATPSNASTDCENASSFTTLTANSGTNQISLISLSPFIQDPPPVLAAESSCKVSVDVTTITHGVFVNVSNELDSQPSFFDPSLFSSGFATATLNVPVQFLTKSFIDDPVAPGGTVKLRFTINNLDRNFAATNISFTDDLDATLTGLVATGLPQNDVCGVGSVVSGTNLLSFGGGTLPAGGSCSFDITLQIPASASSGSYPNTSGAITADVNGSSITGNTASDNLIISTAPILTKSFTNDPVGSGNSATLEFTITNPSTSSTATDISFTDQFDSIMPTASIVPAAGFCNGSGTVNFTPLFNPPMDSIIPATLTIQGVTLLPGASCTFSITLDVLVGTTAGSYPNTTSEITALLGGTESVSGLPASDNLIIVAAPKLTKSFTDDPVQPGGTVTLEFILSHDALASGDATAITFTDDLNSALTGLTASAGQLPLSNVCGASNGTLTGSAVDTLLTFSGAALIPGEVCTFSLTLDVPAAAPAGNHTNTSSGIMATVQGVTATGNPASDDLQISGLVITKEFIDDPIILGGNVTLRFNIENMHPSDNATAISFTDNLSTVLPSTPDLIVNTPLPTIPCGAGSSIIDAGSGFLIFTDGELLAGASCSFDISLTVPVGATDGTYVNTTSILTATLGSSPVASDPAADALVINSNLLALSKEFTNDPVSLGNTVNLHFILNNLEGTQAASNLAFSDDLDAALSGLVAIGLPISACGGTVSGTSIVSLAGGSLAAGAMCEFDVAVNVPALATPNTYTNTTSTVTGTIGGFAVSGNVATDQLEIIDLLVFNKSFDGPSTATGTTVLTFTITNPGSNSVSNIVFSDDLDNVLSGLLANNLPLNDVCGVGSQISGTSFLTFTGGNLPPLGGMCSFDVEVQVPATATSGIFTNTTSDLSQSGLKVSDPATANLVIEPAPTFSKVFSPDTIAVDGTSTLTFTINNSASAVAASSLNFTDNLPAGLEIANPSNSITTCTAGTLTAIVGASVVSYTGGTVATGSTCTVQVDITGGVAATYVNTSGDLISSSGNSGTATDTLIIDPIPVVTPPADINLEATATLTVVVLGTATVADNDVGLVATPSSTGPFPVGTTIVTWSVTDSVGNIGTATQTVTIVDTTNPVVTPPIDITIEATGANTPVTLGTATVTDAVTAGLTATPNNTGPFPVGSTTVTWSATDAAGNIGTATQTIIVEDTTAPVITPPVDITIEATGITTPVTLGTTTVADAVTSGLTATPNNTGPFSVGSTTVTWSATDAAGNTGTATQTVTVEDTTAPVITPPIDITIEATGITTPTALGTATVTDAVTSGLTATPDNTGPFPIGTTTIIWSATDAAGNTGMSTQTVIITPKRSLTGTLPSGDTGNISFTTTDSGCSFINDPEFLDETTVTPTAPPNVQLIDGLVSFVIENCAVGATVEITVDYNQLLPANTVYWKVGTPGFTIPATVNDTSITFSITDGGVADNDSIPGTITDPSGAALLTAINIPTNNTLGVMFLILLLSLSGLFIQRRKYF